VNQGRPELDEATVRQLADGRVFSARQALNAGLIDGIATLRNSIGAVKKRAGLKNVRLVTYNRPYGYRPNYYAMAPEAGRGDVNLINLDITALLDRTSPRFMYLWQPGL
jgi:protease-4